MNSVLLLGALLTAVAILLLARRASKQHSSSQARPVGLSPASDLNSKLKALYDLRQNVPSEPGQLVSMLPASALAGAPVQTIEQTDEKARRETLADIERRAIELLQNIGRGPFPEPEWTTGEPMNAEFRAEIIRGWGKHLEFDHIAGCIRDASLLPYPKETILRAICEQIFVERDDELMFMIAASAQDLADYQDEVGQESLWLGGFDDRLLSSSEFQELSIDQKCNRINAAANGDNAERYKLFEHQVWTELGRITSLVEAAQRRRRASSSPH